MKPSVISTKLSRKDERTVHAMQTLGDKTRYKIFKILLSKKELCVSEIASELAISIPAVSQHFRTFELVGIVERERIGQKVCYHLKGNDSLVKKLIELTSSK